MPPRPKASPSFDISAFIKKRQSEWKTLVPKMRLEDLIEVAFKSPKFRTFIKQNKIRARSIEWDFSSDHPQIRIFQKTRERASLIALILPEGSDENKSIGKRKAQWKPTDLNFKKRNNFERTLMMAKEMEKEKSLVKNMKLLTDVLIDIFEFKNFYLNWDITGTKNFLDLFIWDITKKFDFIFFKPEECENDEETLEALDFLFDEVTSKKLEIKAFNDNIVFRKALKNHEEVQIFGGEFFALECFTNMTCKKAVLYGCDISTQDINKLVKVWRDGQLPNLKQFTAKADESLEDNVLFSGIQKKKSKKKFPRTMYETPKFDIVSKSGKKASIGIDDRTIKFFVWSEDGDDLNEEESEDVESFDDEEEDDVEMVEE